MIRFIVFLLLFVPAAQAEERAYGNVYLGGLARDTSWPYNPPGVSYVMVCNVNGPDGYLSIRGGPGSNYEARRNLKRLAILTIDSAQRQGPWVRVLTAHRQHTENGGLLSDYRDLDVQGWAHDGYLCSFDD